MEQPPSVSIPVQKPSGSGGWMWVFIGIALVIIILTLALLFLSPVKSPPKKTSNASPVTTTTTTTQSSSGTRVTPPTSPSPTKFSFRPSKMYTSQTTFNYDGAKLTHKNLPNIKNWGIDLPLDYTHARISGKIFKFTNPNSSDTTGKFVDDFGNPLSTQPAAFFSNMFELGMFF